MGFGREALRLWVEGSARRAQSVQFKKQSPAHQQQFESKKVLWQAIYTIIGAHTSNAPGNQSH